MWGSMWDGACSNSHGSTHSIGVLIIIKTSVVLNSLTQSKTIVDVTY